MDSSEQYKEMFDKAVEAHPIEFVGFDRTKNIQDQLQRMISSMDNMDEIVKIQFYFQEFLHDCLMSYHLFDSTEQLWLVFYMSEVHDEYWNDSGWQLKVAQEVI